MPNSTRATPDPAALGQAAGTALVDAPLELLRAEWEMLHVALDRTRKAKDKRAEAAALRCIATVEDAILARAEC